MSVGNAFARELGKQISDTHNTKTKESAQGNAFARELQGTGAIPQVGTSSLTMQDADKRRRMLENNLAQTYSDNKSAAQKQKQDMLDVDIAALDREIEKNRKAREKALADYDAAYAAKYSNMQGVVDNRSWEEKYAERSAVTESYEKDIAALHELRELANRVQYEAAGEKALSELDADTLEILDNLLAGVPQNTEAPMQGIADNRSWEEIYAEREAYMDVFRQAMRDKGYTPEETEQLADYRQRQQNKVLYGLAVSKAVEEAESGVGGAISASAKSVPQNLTGGLGYLSAASQTAHNKLTGKDRPLDVYAPEFVGSAAAKAARESVSRQLEENTNWETKLTGNVASFLYNTGMSAADSAAATVIGRVLAVPTAGITTDAAKKFASNAAGVVLGSSVATNALVEAKERGVSDEKALITGLAFGAAEGFFEKHSIDRWFGNKGVKGLLRDRVKQTLKNAGAQQITEGVEELATSVADTIADGIINGNLSDLNTRIRNYVNAGYTEAEAHNMVSKELMQSLAQDFLAGAISGGVMGGVSTGINTLIESKDVSDVYGDSAQELVAETLELDPENKTAQKAQAQLDEGKKLKPTVIRSLLLDNREYIEREEAANPTPEDTVGQEERVALARPEDMTEEEAADIIEQASVEFGEAAGVFKSAYSATQDPYQYAASAKVAYNLGRVMGDKALDYAKKTPNTAGLEDFQLEKLVEEGRQAAKIEMQTTSAIKGKGKLAMPKKLKSQLLTDKQQTDIRVLDAIAKVSGYTIELYESSVDKSGKYVGENGSYSPRTGVIRIDVNAGKNKVSDVAEYALLRTAAHEMTHSFKRNAAPEYNALREFITSVLAEEGQFDRLVEQKQADSRKELSWEQAVDEIVADGCEMMLRDSKTITRLAAENRSLFEKIKDWLTKFFADLKAAFAGVNTAHEEALILEKYADKVQKLWDDALAKSVENMSAVDSVLEDGAEAIPVDEIITDGATVVDEDGAQYSIRSMQADIADGQMFRDLMNRCGWTQEEVGTLRKQLEDLVQYMIPFRNIVDMNETYGREGRKFSPYKPNSDPLYKISLDFSTLCSKRLLTQYVIENLQLQQKRPMSAEEQMAIRDMLIEYRKQEEGLQVACAMCYVEAARLKSPKQIQKWLDDPTIPMRNYFADNNPEFKERIKKAQEDFKESRGYDRDESKKNMKPSDRTQFNKIRPRIREQYVPTAEEQEIIDKAADLPAETFLTAANLANLAGSEDADMRTIYAVYASFVRTATRSKALEADEPYYYGDSTRDNGNGIIVSDSFIESVNRENGMRFSSWSDWRIQHMLDYITAVIDNSVRGAAMHGYTKFGDEVRVLGKTGMMFNLSGVAGTQTGLNEDGSLNFSPTESIDIDEAKALREEFPETAGMQCIGVSDAHIRELLRSEIIDYVIPYHTSGLNAGLRRMANIHGWKDYTKTQHAAIDKSIEFNGQEHWHEEPVFSEFFVGYNTKMSGEEAMRESAKRYVDMCRERGLKPKFEAFLDEPNYWKLLVDRKMVNQVTGKLIQQKPVTPVFDFGAIKGIVDKYVENYKPDMEQKALDYVVENWDTLPKRIKQLKKSGTKAKQVKKSLDTLQSEMVAAQPVDEKVYSERDYGILSDRGFGIPSNRTLIVRYEANEHDSKGLLESVERYKKKAEELKKAQSDLRYLRKKLEKTPETNSEKYREVLDSATRAKTRVEAITAEMNRIESGKAMQELISRELKVVSVSRAEAAKRVAKYRERLNATETRRKLRDKITYRVKKLDKMLRNPTDAKHIPDGLQGTIFDFCELFTEEKGVWYGDRLASVKARYEELKPKADSEFSEFSVMDLYDESIPDMLQYLAEHLNGKRLAELTKSELEMVLAIAGHFAFMVKNENEIFFGNRKANLAETVKNLFAEAGENSATEYVVGNDAKSFRKARDFITTNNLKPIYFFRNKGNTLKTLFDGMLKAQREYALEMDAAKAFVEKTKEDLAYDEWFDPDAKLVMENDAGQRIELTIQQAMSLVATYEREVRSGESYHTTQGGFIYAGEILGDVTTKSGKKVHGVKKVNAKETYESHPMSVTDMAKVVGWLREISPNTIAYVEKMVNYLSSDLADIGNDVCTKLFGYKKFWDEFYFPIKSSSDFLKSEPGQIGKDDSRWKHKGFTKRRIPNANNAFVLDDFDSVWKTHTSEMLMFATMAIPQDSFVRVLNYKTAVDKEGLTPSRSTKNVIETAYGISALQYIDTLLHDVNGGVAVDPREGAYGKWLSIFKKGATALSASVAIQQPSALVRALMYIDLKYIRKGMANPNFNEALEHSGLAVLKTIGGYDTTTGKAGADWLMSKTPEGIGNKVKAAFTFGKNDTGYRDELLYWLPQKMDELSWGILWSAVEAEVADTTDLEKGSDAYWETVTNRFDEIIELTQVYDSVLTRSENMRAKTLAMKAATAFGAEATTTLNIAAAALQDFVAKKPNAKKNLAKATVVLFASIVVNSMLKAIVTAPRDDDESKTLPEKYIEKVVGGIASDVNPMSYFPLLRDIASLFEGFTAEDKFIAPIGDLIESMQKAADERSWENILDATLQVPTLFGVPLENLWRDIKGVYNAFFKTAHLRESSWKGAADAVKAGLGVDDPTIKESAIDALRWDERGNERKRKKALDEITSVYNDKVKKYRLEGVDPKEADKKAKTAIRSQITQALKPLYIAAETTAEKNRIIALARRVYIGGEQLYKDYNFAKNWAADE